MALKEFIPRRQPGVSVTQIIAGASPVPAPDTPLPACIIGEKVNVIKNAKVAEQYVNKIGAGYFSFPELETAAQIFASTVKVMLKNIVFDIAQPEQITAIDTQGPAAGITLGFSGIAEITTITCNAGNTLTPSGKADYIQINSPDGSYYAWFNVTDGTTVDPSVAGKTGIQVDVVSTDANTAVATALVSAVSALGDFGASAASEVVTVTNTTKGSVANTVDGNGLGSNTTGFTISTATNGRNDKVNQLTDTETNPFGAAEVNDFVSVYHSSIGTVETKIVEIIDNSNVLVDVDFPSSIDGLQVTYAVKRYPGEVALTDLDVLEDDITGKPEITEVTTLAGSALPSVGTASYILVDSPSNKYYVWFNNTTTGTNTDPAIAGRTGVQVNFATADLNTAIATSLTSAIDGLTDFSASTASEVVTITTASNGEVESATDFNTGFGIEVTQEGVDTAFTKVYPGDSVVVDHPTQGTIKAVVTKILSPTKIKLNKQMNVSTNVKYSITRSNANFTSILSNHSAEFKPPLGQTTTDILTNRISGSDFSGVQAGDSVRLVRGGEIDSATVVGLVDINRIQLNKSFDSGSVLITVTRVSEVNAPYELTTEFAVPDTNDDGISDGPVFTISGPIKVEDQKVGIADVYVDYNARSVKDANTLIEIGSDLEIETKAGKYVKENKFGVGVALAAANTTTKVYGIPVKGTDPLSWLEALAIAENHRVYNLVMLDQSPTINSFGRTHVNGMSDPFKGKWRVLWSNLGHVFEGVIIPKKAGGLLKYFPASLPADPDPYLTLYDPLSDMNEARIEGFVKYTFPDTEGNDVTVFLQVIDKIDNSTLKLSAKEFNPPAGTEPGRGSYLEGDDITATSIGGQIVSDMSSTSLEGEFSVFYLYSKTEQARALATVANSFGNRRVIYVTNDSCILEFANPNDDPTDDTDNLIDEEVPGYYLCAAYAGLSSGTSPHQPLTNYPLAGVKGVRYAYEYFDSTQMGIIAAGGGLSVYQDVIDASAPMAWMQTTTDTSSVKTIEFSFTKNLDEISYALFDAHQKFPGRNNRVPGAIAKVESQTVAVLQSRNEVEVVSETGDLGTQISNYSFNGFVEDPLFIDSIFSDVEVELPITLNYIDFRVIA